MWPTSPKTDTTLNFACQLAPIMVRHHFLQTSWVVCRMFTPTKNWHNFICIKLFMFICWNNYQIWVSMGCKIHSEQQCKEIQLYHISISATFFRVNWSKQWPHITCQRRVQLLWTMFQPNPTSANFHLCKLCMSVRVNNDQIWLCREYTTDFYQCQTFIKFYIMQLVVISSS